MRPGKREVSGKRIAKRVRRWLLSGLVSVVCFRASLAVAQSQKGETPIISVVAHEDQAHLLVALLEAAVHPHLPDARVIRGSAEEPRGASERQVRLLLDTANPQLWILSLEHQGRSWERRLKGRAADPAALEASAQIAAQASVALLATHVALARDDDTLERLDWTTQSEGRSQGRAEPEPPPLDLAPPVRDQGTTQKESTTSARGRGAESQLVLATGAGYRAQSYAEGLWSHGATVGAELQHAAGIVGGVGLYATPRLRVNSEFGSFSLLRLPAHLWVGYSWRRARGTLTPFFGVLLEGQRVGAPQPVEGIGAADASFQLSFGFGAGLRYGWLLERWVKMQVGVSVVALARVPKFVAEGGEQPLLAPHHVRPTFDLGLMFPLSGRQHRQKSDRRKKTSDHSSVPGH